MSTWPRAHSWQLAGGGRLFREDVEIKAESVPGQDRETILNRLWTGIARDRATSSRVIRSAGVPSFVVPCHSRTSLESLVSVAAHEIPSGRCGRQLKSSPGTSLAVSMSNARYRRAIGGSSLFRDVIPGFVIVDRVRGLECSSERAILVFYRLLALD